MHLVSRRISVELLQPELAAVRWCCAIFATFVPMPEAAVDEDDGFVFRQNDVRRDVADFRSWIFDFGFWIAIPNLRFERDDAGTGMRTWRRKR